MFLKRGQSQESESPCTKEGVSLRLKEFRLGIGLSQADMATNAGMPLPSYKDYEGGKRMPGGDALFLFFQVGININWLLSGIGEAQIQQATPQDSRYPVNVEALAAIMAAVEYARPDMPMPQRVAQAAAAYETSIKEGLITPYGPGVNAPKKAG